MIERHIIVTTDAIGIHKYSLADLKVDFLRNWHRHKLFIRVKIKVTHEDRELEFYAVQDQLNKYLKTNETLQPSVPEALVDLEFQSCEWLAEKIINFLIGMYGDRDIACEVWEDNENAGVVEYAKVDPDEED